MQHDELTSLQKFWGGGNQEEWQQLKKAAILKAVEFDKKSHPSFVDLFTFLAEQRHLIAVQLGHYEDIQKRGNHLPVFKEMRRNQILATVAQPDKARYKDFYPRLKAYFDSLTKQSGYKIVSSREEMKDFLRLYGDLLKRIKFIDAEKPIDDVLATLQIEECIIKFNDIPYSKIYRLNGSIFLVSNPVGDNVNTIIENITENIYPLIQSSADKNVTLTLGLIIAWHLAHASPLLRGSASVLEMVLEVIFSNHDIKFILPNDPTIDWIAMFSGSISEFADKLNVKLDKATLDKVNLLYQLRSYKNELLLEQANSNILSKMMRFFSPSPHQTTLSAIDKLITSLEKDKEANLESAEIDALSETKLHKVLTTHLAIHPRPPL